MRKMFKESQKVRMQESRVKTVLTTFFDAKGIIHHEFVPQKQTVNGKFYKDLIKRFIALNLSFRKVGPGIFCTTVHRRILRALAPSFGRNKRSP
jgi:hypothetical protein